MDWGLKLGIMEAQCRTAGGRWPGNANSMPCRAATQHAMLCHAGHRWYHAKTYHAMPCRNNLRPAMPLFTVRRASLAAPSASFTMRTSAGLLPLRMASVTALQVWCGRGRAREACQGAAMLN